jgi:hypothetical protein
MSSLTLKAGDLLLYSGSGFFSRLIKIKTWSSISHVEIAAGDGTAWASRDGVGVGRYPMRTDGLRAILRPKGRLSLKRAELWHATVDGQAYDWLGLLRFFTVGKQSQTKSFCSEYACRWYRASGIEPFSKDYDADLVSPGMFLSSSRFTTTWRDIA